MREFVKKVEKEKGVKEREKERQSSSDEDMQVPRDCHAGKSRLIGSFGSFHAIYQKYRVQDYCTTLYHV